MFLLYFQYENIVFKKQKNLYLLKILTMTNTIGAKMKELREEFKFSQEQVANYLWINRVVLANIEWWIRKVKENDPIISNVAKLFEITEEELINGNFLNICQKVDKKDKYNKFKNLILYILSRCGHKPNIWKTVLNKLLYFSDFNYYEFKWKSITDETYHKLPRGPVPKNIDAVLGQMEQAKQITSFETEFCGYKQIRYMPNIKYDLSQFNWLEIEVIDDVIEKLSNMTAKQVSDYSHDDVPYMVAKNLWDKLSYNQVFHRTADYVVNPENND